MNATRPEAKGQGRSPSFSSEQLSGFKPSITAMVQTIRFLPVRSLRPQCADKPAGVSAVWHVFGTPLESEDKKVTPDLHKHLVRDTGIE